MYKYATAVALVVGVLLAAATVPSEEAVAQGAPSLLGVWEGRSEVLNYNGFNTGVWQIEVTEQRGARFRGTKSWRLDESGAAGHDGTQETWAATEQFIGIVDFDNETLYLPEVNDVAIQFGRIINVDAMELILVESGEHAAVIRTILIRQPSGNSP